MRNIFVGGDITGIENLVDAVNDGKVASYNMLFYNLIFYFIINFID